MNEKISPHLVCPISGQCFYDPVTTSNGQTFEREKIEAWIQQCIDKKKPITCPNTNTEITAVLTPNALVRGMAREFVEKNPQIYKDDELYLPNRLKEDLVSAISSGDSKLITAALAVDPRLVTVELNAAGQDAFELACEQSSLAVFTLIISKVPVEKLQMIKIGSDESFAISKSIASHLNVSGLEVLSDYLKFDPKIYYTILAFQAIMKFDLTLLEIVLTKVDVNVHQVPSKRTMLHAAVFACLDKADSKSRPIVVSEEMNRLFGSLFMFGANGKIVDKDNMTPTQLALKLGFPELAKIIETERRRAKLAPLFEPLQQQIALLTERNNLLEQKNAAQAARLLNHEQKIVQLESQQESQLAISRGLAEIERQKKIKAFVPVITKSFNFKDKVKDVIAVGPHHLVCSLADENSRGVISSMAIVDLRKPATQSIVKSIPFSDKVPYHGSLRFSFMSIDETRFVYCNEINEYNKHHPVNLILWNVSSMQKERDFLIPYEKINLVQVIDKKRLLISGEKKYERQCSILDLASGHVEFHQHLALLDFLRDEYTVPTSHHSSVDLAYVAYEKDRHGHSPKEFRLYNCLTLQNIFLSRDNISDFSGSSSRKIFKFISNDLIAMSSKSQYGQRELPQLRLFNIQSKNYVQTFIPPKLPSAGFSNYSYEGFFDVCLISEDILVALIDDPGNKAGATNKLIMWDLKTSQIKHTVFLDENAKKLLYDEQRQVLYCKNSNSVDVIQVFPEALPINASKIKQVDSEKSVSTSKVFNV